MGAHRVILHVDMDAFYAAIEQRDRPELRGRPLVIGADPKGGRGRGVVATASYEARAFGIASAIAISKAYRLCPHAVFLLPDMDKYAEVSRQVMAILREFTELVEPISIDEAFLDVTGRQRSLGSGESIGRLLKEAIRRGTSLTASVGVATSKLVAKTASDIRKPDGLVVVPPGEEAAFLAPLPVRRLWGVGPKMEERLFRAGIHTIGQLAQAPPSILERRLGTHGHDLQQLARGSDERPVLADAGEAKSVGAEHTYGEDTADLGRIRLTLLRLADTVAARLRGAGLRARTVTLKYRDETFRTVTRARTLGSPSDSAAAVFEAAWAAFCGVHGRLKVRLVGIYTSGFAESQLGLFEGETDRLDRIRDEVGRKVGPGALTRASLLRRSP